jgi:hypothetical protein
MPRCPCCGATIEEDFVRLDRDAMTVETAEGRARVPGLAFELIDALVRAWPRDARRDWLIEEVIGEAFADPAARLRQLKLQARRALAPLGLTIEDLSRRRPDGALRLGGAAIVNARRRAETPGEARICA